MMLKAVFGKKDKKDKEQKIEKEKEEKKSSKSAGIAAIALKATGKTALWAAKQTASVAGNVALATTKQVIKSSGQVASAALLPASHAEEASNAKWAQKNSAWLKEEGKDFLQKIYSQETRFADATQAGSLIHADGRLFHRSGLKKGAEHKPLYHQLNRNSVTKTVKTINRLVNGKKNHAVLRREYLLAIVSVMWHIHDLAIQSNQELKRGSYKIVDPDEKLFQFLKGYAQFATGALQPEFLQRANDFAYRRSPEWYLSSHYTHSSFSSAQYGLDMRLWGGHPTLDILPNESSHLLFGQVEINGKKYTFLKAEQIGLGHPLEYLEHASHLFFGKRETGDKNRRESHIPADLEKAFEAYLAATSSKKPQPFTISNMYDLIQSKDNSDISQQMAIRQIAHCLEKYGYENDAHIRTGQEVIIDLSSLDEKKKSPRNTI